MFLLWDIKDANFKKIYQCENILLLSFSHLKVNWKVFALKCYRIVAARKIKNINAKNRKWYINARSHRTENKSIILNENV